MDEGIIADLDHVLETIQKIHMGSGYVIEQPIRQFLEIQLIQFRLAEAIAEHCFTPAKAEQKPCRLHIALCGLQENFLMIAFQEAHGPGRLDRKSTRLNSSH